jgi:hypothetical protein
MTMTLGYAGGQTIYPPSTRSWFEVLPAPFNEDVDVVCVMRPDSWTPRMVTAKDDRYQFGVLVSPKKNMAGLQVLDSKVETWRDHDKLMREYNLTMANPAFIGPISRFPQTLCMELERSPLLFIASAMWRNYLDLRQMWTPDANGLKA